MYPKSKGALAVHVHRERNGRSVVSLPRPNGGGPGFTTYIHGHHLLSLAKHFTIQVRALSTVLSSHRKNILVICT